MLPILALLPLEATALDSAVERAMHGVRGAAVVLEAATGEVTACANCGDAKRLAASPGSAVKPFVLAALLASNSRASAGQRACDLRFRLAGRQLDCSHPATAHPFDAATALAYSCNRYFAEAAAASDAQELTNALRRYGFTVPVAPRTPEELMLLALGEQGITVTPLELAGAYRKLALARASGNALLAPVFEGMEGAVRFGSAQLARPPGVSVSAKTGTSAHVSRTGTHAWLAGWTPSARPESVVVVFVREGKGGATAAPIAREIFARLTPRRAPPLAGAVSVRLFSQSAVKQFSVDGKAVVAPAAFRGRHQLQADGGDLVPVEGELEIKRGRQGAMAVLKLPLDRYIAAVLAGEVKNVPLEAAKAMAVAARTYALGQVRRHAADGYDFCDSTHCQDLRLAALGDAEYRAVASTQDAVVTFGGALARVFYHSHCGGSTERASDMWPGIRVPYLVTQPDTYCVATGKAPWSARVRAKDLAVIERGESGRAAKLRVDGRVMTREQFQMMNGYRVRSGFFEIMREGDGFVLEGWGKGHGVGLCHTGTIARARHGHTYDEILAFYFPGTEVEPRGTTGSRGAGDGWRKISGERVDFYYAAGKGASDAALAAMELAIVEAEARSGFTIGGRVRLREYPTIAKYRDATGEPGWVAASTLGATVRLQPAAILRARGVLDSTLLHEALHVAVDQKARPGTPDWFIEGLVLHFADPDAAPVADRVVPSHFRNPPSREAMRRAYDAARSRVKRLVERYGLGEVSGWLARGLPREIAAINSTHATISTR